MADEYDDEEFAPEDGEVVYDAEFDDEEDQEAQAEEASEVQDVGDAYQQSYDAEFEPAEAQPTKDEEIIVVLPTDPEIFIVSDKPESRSGAGSRNEADAVTPMGIEVPERETFLEHTQERSPRVRGSFPDSPMKSPRSLTPTRRLSEPILLIEQCVDPVLQAKLTRRSSSPRMRPAPIARLHSVEELCAAAPDDLVVPTNAITEEAAVITSNVMCETSNLTSPGLTKRTSSASFVPRLPSLLEATIDLPVTPQNDLTSSYGAREAESEEGDAEGNDEKGSFDEDEYEVSNRTEENDGESEQRDEPMHDQDHHKERETTEKVISMEGNHAFDCPISMSTEPNNSSTTESSPSVVAMSEVIVSGLSFERSSTEKQVVSVGGKTQSYDEPQANTVELEGHTEGSSGRRSGDLREASSDQASERSGSYRSTPTPLSEHLPDDYADDTEIIDRLQQVLAEVGLKGIVNVETAITEALDGEVEYIVDPDDEHRRETQYLLQEANSLIDREASTVQVVKPPNTAREHLDEFQEDDPSDLYGGEDHFSDMDYDSEDEELTDNGYFDGEFDEPVHDIHLLASTVSIPSEKNDVAAKMLIVTDQSKVPAVVVNKSKPETATTLSSGSPTNASNAAKNTSPAKPAQSSFQSNSPRDNKQFRGPLGRSFSQGFKRAAERPRNPVSSASPLKPEVPKLTPKAPVLRQGLSTPSQSHRVTVLSANGTHGKQSSENDNVVSTLSSSSRNAVTSKTDSCRKHSGENDRAAPPRKPQGPRQKIASPTKSTSGEVRSASPTRGCLDDPPSSPPRKAPVFKQKRTTKLSNLDESKKKLKPVKCPPNLRVDLPHVDKEKREWLLLNMFRHGDNIDKYDPFIPTTSPEQAIELHLPLDALKRPLSATQIFNELCQAPRQSTSKGSYGRHGGRKIVDRPVDPRVQERERNWNSSAPSVSTIPPYDSILDKYCKTVTSAVVQRRIYETRMDDLSPQLAMVLEKRAFKEWKHSDSEGFGAVSNSYKTAVVSVKGSNTSSMKALLTPRPPSTPVATTLTSGS